MTFYKPNPTLYRLTLAFTFAAFLFDLIAFLSPYWVESNPAQNSQFVRLGLWVACFDGYLHWNDFVNKAYFGCWYIYYPEYDNIRTWLNPGWFYLVQMLCIVSFVLHCVAIFLVGCQSCAILKQESPNVNILVTFCHFVSSIALLVGLLAMGINSRDTRWMPWPERNRLGYAYYFAIFSMAASVVAFWVLFVRYLQQPKKSSRRAYRGKRMAPSGSGPFDPRANPRAGGSYYGADEKGAVVEPLSPGASNNPYDAVMYPGSYYDQGQGGSYYSQQQYDASPYENEKGAYDEYGNPVQVHSPYQQNVDGTLTEDSAV